jgi:putative ABC transport system substrate-binding protein
MATEIEVAARPIGIRIQFVDVQDSKEIEGGFRAATKAHAEALFVLGNPVLNAHRTEVADLAVKSRLPAVYGQPDLMAAGGLMFYGASITEMFRRAAIYVDKILKGAKPADLPVEQPTKFELIINLKTAKQIGLIIPPNVLARADKVIR